MFDLISVDYIAALCAWKNTFQLATMTGFQDHGVVCKTQGMSPWTAYFITSDLRSWALKGFPCCLSTTSVKFKLGLNMVSECM